MNLCAKLVPSISISGINIMIFKINEKKIRFVIYGIFNDKIYDLWNNLNNGCWYTIFNLCNKWLEFL